MGRLALVGGNSLVGVEVPAGDWVVVQRHGEDYALPHEIDNEANMRRVTEAGCDRVLALGSVGGLKRELGPGTFVCPSDFVALGGTPSSRDDRTAHLVPGFDPDWRRAVVDAWGRRAAEPLVEGGVYWQTAGPRLETRAGIRPSPGPARGVGRTNPPERLLALGLGLGY